MWNGYESIIEGLEDALKPGVRATEVTTRLLLEESGCLA